MSEAATLRVLRALDVAARAHANQRRKGAAQEPYVNHLVEVAREVGEATGGEEVDLVVAALLHDIVEDTRVTPDEVAAAFGPTVRDIVLECSDDMSLPKDERKRRRLELAATKSRGAKLVKIADMISNLRATGASPPAGWPADWCLGYVVSCRALHRVLAGENASLDRRFAETADATEEAVRAHFVRLTAGGTVRFQLDASVGQQVHLLYLANTDPAADRPLDRDRLAAVLEASFPSFTILDGESVFEGRRRPILMVRVRTDSTDAIVAAAQRLCLEFEQRFVGVEIDGRYVRVYADDTG